MGCYRFYTVYRDGRKICVGTSAECAECLGIAVNTFYRYATTDGAAPFGVEIVRHDERQDLIIDGRRPPCVGCKQDGDCAFLCAAYRKWFARRWQEVRAVWRKALIKRKVQNDENGFMHSLCAAHGERSAREACWAKQQTGQMSMLRTENLVEHV